MSDTVVDLLTEEEKGQSRRRLTKREFRQKKTEEKKLWELSNLMGVDLNPRFREYYLAQLPSLRAEWDAFHKVLSAGLPVTFRLSMARNPFAATALKLRIQKECDKLKTTFIEMNGEVVHNLLTPLLYFPESLVCAFQLNIDSATLARNPVFAALSDLIVSEAALGHLVRQEAVSMIPALLLDVASHHCVLDVCAAPGSKTEQALSLLYAAHATDDSLPSGMVVANDPDPRRIQTIKTRYARCGSPNLVITCARAEDLAAMINAPAFDRILCDVPCTGDGTFRKFPHQWRLFRPRFGVEIHGLQLQIAVSSASLLRAGGRMVYSTCSLNPVEDEAVVAALLLRFAGALRLVDVRAEGALPLLKYRPGLHTWRCDADALTLGEEEEQREKSVKRLPAIAASMLPPSAEAAAAMHLERCMRLMPHDQNTGGFFVAVLERVDAPNVPNAPRAPKATEVSREDALHALRQLGFNPTHASAGSPQEWRRATGAHVLEPLGERGGLEVLAPLLGLSAAHAPPLFAFRASSRVASRPSERAMAVTAAEPSAERRGKRRREQPVEEPPPLPGAASSGVVVVSPMVRDALSGWAGQCAVQAGQLLLADGALDPRGASLLCSRGAAAAEELLTVLEVAVLHAPLVLGFDDLEAMAPSLCRALLAAGRLSFVRPEYALADAVEDSLDAFKRRPSKAEKRRRRKGEPVAAAVAAAAHPSNPLRDVAVGGRHEVGLLFERDDDSRTFALLTTADVCCSFLAALKAADSCMR